MADSAHRPDDVMTRRRRPKVLDWTSDLDTADREELEALRAAVGEREETLESVQLELRDTRRRLNDVRAALRMLERSRPWQRPAVWREIRSRGLLDTAAAPAEPRKWAAD